MKIYKVSGIVGFIFLCGSALELREGKVLPNEDKWLVVIGALLMGYAIWNRIHDPKFP